MGFATAGRAIGEDTNRLAANGCVQLILNDVMQWAKFEATRGVGGNWPMKQDMETTSYSIISGSGM